MIGGGRDLNFFIGQKSFWTGYGFAESFAKMAVELLTNQGFDAVFIDESEINDEHYNHLVVCSMSGMHPLSEVAKVRLPMDLWPNLVNNEWFISEKMIDWGLEFMKLFGLNPIVFENLTGNYTHIILPKYSASVVSLYNAAISKLGFHPFIISTYRDFGHGLNCHIASDLSAKILVLDDGTTPGELLNWFDKNLHPSRIELKNTNIESVWHTICSILVSISIEKPKLDFGVDTLRY
ncbi:hypothetical protein N9K65_02170 [Candidatus Poseidoniales archaeon]|nr:hypothetical protein [Candidatus Poseidoniales archaeon]